MFELSARAQDYVERTKQFIQNEIEPIETDFWHEVHELNQGGDPGVTRNVSFTIDILPFPIFSSYRNV